MNEHLTTGSHGVRLIKQWEKGPRNKPGVRLTREGAALDAYLCPAGKPTISFGVCTHPDGRPVRLGDSIAEDQVDLYLLSWLARVEAQIKATVTIELQQHQFDALVSWVFNLGIGSLRSSTKLLPYINAGQWREAASQMLAFVYSTMSKNGKPWKRALFGLFIRRCCEACLLMGWDWTYACDPARLSLPTRCDWHPDWVNPANGQKGRYYDAILDGKTPFANIERDAKDFPLADALEIPSEATPDIVTPGVEAEPAVVPPTQMAGSAAAPSPQSNSAPSVSVPVESGAGEKQAAGSGAPAGSRPVDPAGTKPPSKNSVPITDVPYKVDPTFGLKPMEETERWQASLAQNGGMAAMRVARYGWFGTGPATVATYIEKDPIFSALFLAVIGIGAVYAYGYVRKAFGDWKRHHAEKKASQGIY